MLGRLDEAKSIARRLRDFPQIAPRHALNIQAFLALMQHKSEG